MTVAAIGTYDAQPYGCRDPNAVAKVWNRLVPAHASPHHLRRSSKRRCSSEDAMSFRSLSTRSLSTLGSLAESSRFSRSSDDASSVASFNEQAQERRSSACSGSLRRSCADPTQGLDHGRRSDDGAHSHKSRAPDAASAASTCSSGSMLPAGVCWPSRKACFFWKEEEAAGNRTVKLKAEKKAEVIRQRRSPPPPQQQSGGFSASPERGLQQQAPPAAGQVLRRGSDVRCRVHVQPDEQPLRRAHSVDVAAGLSVIGSVHPDCRYYAVPPVDANRFPDPDSYGHETCLVNASWAAVSPMADVSRSSSPTRHSSFSPKRRLGPGRSWSSRDLRECAGADSHALSALMAPLTPTMRPEDSHILVCNIDYAMKKARPNGGRYWQHRDPVTHRKPDPEFLPHRPRLRQTRPPGATPARSWGADWMDAAGVPSLQDMDGSGRILEHQELLSPSSSRASRRGWSSRPLISNFNEIGWEPASREESPRSVASSCSSPRRSERGTRSPSRSHQRDCRDGMPFADRQQGEQCGSLSRPERPAPSELMRTPRGAASRSASPRRSRGDGEPSAESVASMASASLNSRGGRDLLTVGSSVHDAGGGAGNLPRSTPAARRQRRLEAARSGGLGPGPPAKAAAGSRSSAASSLVSMPSVSQLSGSWRRCSGSSRWVP
eukprot:TRINITY_DN32607_c0_g1_i1.p1 TRINITY_DN32607_c0_g1~~TRINITY_DN32607_c0_g1_i1.p1  ORF type:complete len:679 (-),score=96.86 TRINITY_DN32607_c0_g1_i1:131-2119(-)